MHKIAISVGELSGDEHAAAVVKAIKELTPGVQLRGMGGRNLRAVGVDTIVDSEKSGSVMGFSAVFLSLGKIFRAMSSMRKLLQEWQPDCLILVDYADFNLRLACYAKKLGIKVLYFIPPQTWAWRAGRVKLMQEVIDRAAVIFPFERGFYESQGYKRCVFVGHPFVGTIKSGQDLRERESLCSELGLDPDKPLVAILPGSRKHELQRHYRPMLEAIHILRQKLPEVQGIVALPPTLNSQDYPIPIDLRSFIKICSGNTLSVLRSADVGVLKSGTSNLQAAFSALPFLMFYRASEFSKFIADRFIKLNQFSIVNIIRPNTVVELLQEQACGSRTAHELERLLLDQEYRTRIQAHLAEIVSSLANQDDLQIFEGAKNAAERVARLVLELCE